MIYQILLKIDILSGGFLAHWNFWWKMVFVQIGCLSIRFFDIYCPAILFHKKCTKPTLMFFIFLLGTFISKWYIRILDFSYGWSQSHIKLFRSTKWIWEWQNFQLSMIILFSGNINSPIFSKRGLVVTFQFSCPLEFSHEWNDTVLLTINQQSF